MPIPRQAPQLAPPSAHSARPPWAALDGQGGLAAAGYRWTRHLRFGPVTGEQSHALSVGQRTLNDVRQALPHGRANVTVDNEVTGLSSLLRHQAARGLDRFPPGSLTWPDPDPARQHQRRVGELAARALYMGAGVCGDMAALAWADLAPALHPGDRMAMCFGLVHDHAWVEICASGGSGATPAHVVVDPWGDGPALLAEDCALIDLPDVLRDVQRPDEALVATAALSARSNELRRLTTPEAELMGLMLSGTPWDLPGYAPTPIVRASALRESRVLARESLHQRSERAAIVADPDRAGRLARPQTLDRLSGADGPLSGGRDPLLRLRSDIVAHAVAREAGVGVREASVLAPDIVQAGLRLGQPVQSPQVVAPLHQRAAARQWLLDRLGGPGQAAI